MKKNTWNFKRLVDDSFVPLAQRTSVLYSRLTDFIIHSKIKLQKDFGSIVSLPHQFRQNTMIWTIDLYGLGYALLAHPYFKKSLVWLFSVQMG